MRKLKQAMRPPRSSAARSYLALAGGLLALALGKASAQTFTQTWTVAKPVISGTSTVTSSIQGFYANTSGPDYSDSKSIQATISVGQVVYSAPVPDAPEGWMWEYRPGQSVPPTDISIDLTVTASWYGNLTLTVPSEDTHAAATAGATLTGFSFTAQIFDVSHQFSYSHDKNYTLAPGGSFSLTGQVSTYIYAPRVYDGNVGAQATVSLSISGDGAQGYETYELVKIPGPPGPPIPEPEEWAVVALMPLGAWGLARSFRRVRSVAKATR